MKPLLQLGNCIVSGLVLIALASLSLAACTTAATPTQTAAVVQTTPSSTPSLPLAIPTISPTNTPTHTPIPSPILSITPTPIQSDLTDFDTWAYVLRPAITEIKGFTATIEFYIKNERQTPSPESILFLFDGSPERGGTLITQIEIPSIEGEGYYYPEVYWNVKGKAGEHQLFRFLCPASAPSSLSICRADSRIVTIPRLSWGIEITGEREIIKLPRGTGQLFHRGDMALITVYAANLGTMGTLSFTMITAALGNETIAEEGVILHPKESVERVYAYNTTDVWGSGALVRLRLENIEDEIPALQNRATRERYASFSLPEGAYFIADPLTGTVPLTVTFMDRSGPRDGIESWLWSFGDGLSSTHQFPAHTYVEPGAYTVTLTTTVRGVDLRWVRRLITLGGITDTTLLRRTFTFTATRPGYINVFLLEERS